MKIFSAIFALLFTSTFIFAQSAFSVAEERAPELLSLSKNVVPVDALYNANGEAKSEAGLDEYCKLYAEILKARNEKDAGKKSAETSEIRENLESIYQGINHIFCLAIGGGTYFGHESTRICARTEYEIHKYLNEKKYRDSFTKSLKLTDKEIESFEDFYWTVAIQWRANLGDSSEDWFAELGYRGFCNRMYEIKCGLISLESKFENEFYYDRARDYINQLMQALLEQ